MDLFIRRSTLSFALLALGTMSTTLRAAEFEEVTNTGDWYVSLGVTVAPDVKEKTSSPNGSTTYDWKDQKDDVAPRLAVGYLACSGGNLGGWALGTEFVATSCEITPATYDAGGLTFANTSRNHLRYSTVGATLFGGYEFGINPDDNEISAFLLLAPFIGGGMALADSEVRDSSGTYANDSGIGWYLEGGLRAGFVITERHWLGGVLVDFTVGTSEVDVNFGGDRKSTLTLNHIGVGGSLVIGYRL